MKTRLSARRASSAAAAVLGGLLAFGIAGEVRAQLGETPAQIARRFGPPIQHHARVRNHQVLTGPALVGDVHRRDGCYIRVVYGRGVSVQAEFSRCEGPLLRPQVEAILATAAEGSQWKSTSALDGDIVFYRRVDGQALASWTIGPNSSLLIAADDSGAIWQKLLLQAR